MKKANDLLLFLFVLLLPTQLGKHFFLPFSYISGVRIDYLAPTIHLTDLIALALIVLHIKQIFRFLRKKPAVIFLILCVINIVFALSAPIAVYKLIKILEVLCIYIIFSSKKIDKKYLLTALCIGAGVELLLASLQFTMKQSLQGIFYFLGERYFTLSTPDIAKAALNGVQILRPYGTFSHPNSLAGFYLVVYMMVLTYQPFAKYVVLKHTLLMLCTLLILLSFSKIAIGSFLLLNAVYLLKRRAKIACDFCVFGRLFLLLALSLLFLTARGDIFSYVKRITLMLNATDIFLADPFLGTGLGNYLLAQAKYPHQYAYFFLQPVHNIFLLYLVESGIILFGYTVYYLFHWIKKNIHITPLLYVLGAVLLTGMFDHYWLTLQQNLLLLPAICGFLATEKKYKEG